MIVIDANLLLYAYDEADPRHPVVARWFQSLMSSSDDVGLPLLAILAFIRISTDHRVFEQPRPVATALAIVESCLSRPNVRLLEPTGGHWATLADLAARGQARGPQLMDAHLAAVTIEHGATLATADRGFARFPGLRTLDPTAA
jgi:Predicted nucleic acid-binding protein, contains PIN domain